MATQTLKILGQSLPTATVLTALYTVPALTQAVVSSLIVCNQNATAINWRLSIAPGGAADSQVQYIYGGTVGAGLAMDGLDTFIATSGFSLGAGDVVRCYSDTANVSFMLSGMEIS